MAKQINILIQAYKYLEWLRRYTDPLSGRRLPAPSAAYENPVHRLFSLSGRTLTQIILQDSPKDRPSFYITPEQQASLRPKSWPVHALALVKAVNLAVSPLQCRELSRTVLLDWLEESGCLLPPDAAGIRGPSALGESAGIRMTRGARPSLRFTRDAQQFILDRLQDIAQYGQAQGIRDKRQRVKIKNPETLRADIRGMELLSQGLHPAAGAPLSPQDPLGQQRLRRCFAYTAWAMGRSLEAGFYTAKAPFTLPRERWKEIEISREPLPLAQFLRAVSAQRQDPTAIQALSHPLVLKYLTAQDLMQKIPREKNGKTYYHYRPTPAGNRMGFGTMEVTDDSRGSYPVLSCDAKAQQYLADHLAQLISLAAEGWGKP